MYIFQKENLYKMQRKYGLQEVEDVFWQIIKVIFQVKI